MISRLFRLAVLVFPLSLFAQTNPSAFNLSGGPYSFTQWAATEPAATYPANMMFHRGGTQDPLVGGFNATTDWTGAYNLGSGSRIVGQGTNGVSFVNIGTAGNIGAAVVALDATGRQDITIDFTAGLIAQGDGSPVPREYAIRLQYRIGTAGVWTDVPGPVQYSSAGQTNGHSQNFTGIALPASCNNQPELFVRWVYGSVATNNGGTRPHLRLDDIQISSSLYVCSEPTTQASGLTVAAIGSSSVDLTWTNGNGVSRLVIARLGSPVTDLPVDGVNYTASASFGTAGTELGSGYVVYNGTGNAVTVNGLTPGNTYHFTVIERDCSPADYLLTNPPVANASIPTVPLIICSPLSLPTFTSSINTPTLPDSLTVSGVFLTDDITVTAPTHFEVSLAFGSGYSSSLVLAQASGVVNATKVYVRFHPTASGSHTGNVDLSSTGASSVNVAVSGNVVQMGTLPSPFVLCQGDYSFTEWASTESVGTYPSNMVFHRFNAQDPQLTAVDTSNYLLAYNLTSGSRINGLGQSGIAFLNTGTNGNMGAAVVAVNSQGRGNIQANFTCELLAQSDGAIPRVYNIRLQYKIGNGAWTDVPGPVQFSSAGLTAGDVQTFNAPLPGSCDNQSNVYLRWFYHQQPVAGAGGSRPRIRLDDITISSTTLNLQLTDVAGVPASESVSISSLVNGPVNTDADGVKVWEFTVREGGAAGDADALPTIISELVLSAGPQNTLTTFTTSLAAAALFKGSTKLQDAVIGATSLTFSGLNEIIADDASETYSVRLTLAASGIIDQSVLQLGISSSGITVGDECSSSGVASFSPVFSDETMNLIEVVATELVYDVVPANVTTNQNFLVTVSARDANGNIDTDARDVVIGLGTTGTGTVSSTSGLGPVAMNSGEYTWSDLQYDVAETFELLCEDNSSTPLTASALINAVNPCLAPTTQASSLQFFTIAQNSMTLSWTNGNGSNRLVIARAGAPVADLPVNGISYTANSVFGTAGAQLGSGYVVYNGPGNSMSLTGLTAGTTYHFAVVEYNCNPPQYLLPELSGNQATLPNSVEELSAETVNVFPNPFTNELHVRVNDLRMESVELVSAIGALVYTQNVNSNTVQLDVSALPTGIYFLKVKTESGIRTVKVIRN